jgi:putative ABC transport system permease protein
MAIVLLEALGVGIIGSLLGLLGGVGALPLLREAIERLDVALPLDDLAMTTDAIALSVAIGVGVTLAAALVPAWRATRIAPLEALRTAKLPPPRRDPVRTALALVLLAAGAALLSWALLGDLGLATLAPGFFGVVLVGAALLGSRLVVPLALLVALPLQLIYGVSGRIARRNATRHPRRTSATAAALAIVVTIVSFAAVLSASYERTSADTVDFRFQGELVVQGFREGVTLPPEVERALADVPGVAHVGEMAVAQGITEAIDGAIDVNGVDPADAAQTYRFRWRDGSQRTLARLGDRDAVVFHDLADELDVDIGDDVEVLTRTGGSARYRVVGVFIDDPNDQVGELITTRAALRRDFGEHRLLNVAATLAPGAAPDEARRHAKQLIETRFPAARVYDKAELRQVFADEAADFQRMILALLSLAIVISVLGVANTISLSIHERTREIAILRALGATRGQVRAIVHQEGMVTSLVGGSVGAALGAALGGVFVASVAGSGFVFAFPVPVIALIVAATLLAGFLAAALPGRRAAEAPMLEAVADA